MARAAHEEEDFSDIYDFVKEDEEPEPEQDKPLESIIEEEKKKFEEVQAKRREHIRAMRPWSAPALSSPRPQSQWQKKIEAVEAASQVSTLASKPRQEYAPPERPLLTKLPDSEGLSYLAPPRPQSADTARLHRKSQGSVSARPGSTGLANIMEDAPLVEDASGTPKAGTAGTSQPASGEASRAQPLASPAAGSSPTHTGREGDAAGVEEERGAGQDKTVDPFDFDAQLKKLMGQQISSPTPADASAGGSPRAAAPRAVDPAAARDDASEVSSEADEEVPEEDEEEEQQDPPASRSAPPSPTAAMSAQGGDAYGDDADDDVEIPEVGSGDAADEEEERAIEAARQQPPPPPIFVPTSSARHSQQQQQQQPGADSAQVNNELFSDMRRSGSARAEAAVAPARVPHPDISAELDVGPVVPAGGEQLSSHPEEEEEEAKAETLSATPSHMSGHPELLHPHRFAMNLLAHDLHTLTGQQGSQLQPAGSASAGQQQGRQQQQPEEEEGAPGHPPPPASEPSTNYGDMVHPHHFAMELLAHDLRTLPAHQAKQHGGSSSSAAPKHGMAFLGQGAANAASAKQQRMSSARPGGGRAGGASAGVRPSSAPAVRAAAASGLANHVVAFAGHGHNSSYAPHRVYSNLAATDPQQQAGAAYGRSSTGAGSHRPMSAGITSVAPYRQQQQQQQAAPHGRSTVLGSADVPQAWSRPGSGGSGGGYQPPAAAAEPSAQAAFTEDAYSVAGSISTIDESAMPQKATLSYADWNVAYHGEGGDAATGPASEQGTADGDDSIDDRDVYSPAASTHSGAWASRPKTAPIASRSSSTRRPASARPASSSRPASAHGRQHQHHSSAAAISSPYGAAGSPQVYAPPPQRQLQRPMSAQPRLGQQHHHHHHNMAADQGLGQASPPASPAALGANATAAVDVGGLAVSVYVADTVKRIMEANRWMAVLGLSKRYRLKNRSNALDVQVYDSAYTEGEATPGVQPPTLRVLTQKQFMATHARLKAQVASMPAQPPINHNPFTLIHGNSSSPSSAAAAAPYGVTSVLPSPLGPEQFAGGGDAGQAYSGAGTGVYVPRTQPSPGHHRQRPRSAHAGSYSSPRQAAAAAEPQQRQASSRVAAGAGKATAGSAGASRPYQPPARAYAPPSTAAGAGRAWVGEDAWESARDVQPGPKSAPSPSKGKGNKAAQRPKSGTELRSNAYDAGEDVLEDLEYASEAERVKRQIEDAAVHCQQLAYEVAMLKSLATE